MRMRRGTTLSSKVAAVVKAHFRFSRLANISSNLQTATSCLMLFSKFAWAAALLLSAATATSTTGGKDCATGFESDAERAARLASEIPNGGLGILVIDQQVDFHPGGSLAIASANADAARIAAFISNHSSELSQVVFTMDSHQRYHIAHGIFWENDAGDSPDPFTTIYAQNITDGVWKPRDSSLNDYVLAYTQSLEASGKFSLTIWPEHCVIGSPGHNIATNVLDAALEWTKESLKPIQYVMKGSNPFTEHYSALRAEYELAYDPSTSLNTALIKSLQRAGKLVIVGEALSHCVNFTVRDLVAAWPAERLSDLVILTDCSSPVAGFEAEAEQFLSDMAAKGLTLTTSTEFKAQALH